MSCESGIPHIPICSTCIWQEFAVNVQILATSKCWERVCVLSVALACTSIMRLSSTASTKLPSNSPECTCSQVCNFVCSRRFCHLDVSEAACGSNMHDTVQNYWCFVGARLCLQGAVHSVISRSIRMFCLICCGRF